MSFPKCRKRKRETGTGETLAVTPGFVWGEVTSLPAGLFSRADSESDDDSEVGTGEGGDSDDDESGMRRAPLPYSVAPLLDALSLFIRFLAHFL